MGKGCEQEAGEAIVAEIDADVGAPIRVYDKDDPRRERQGGQQNQGSLQRTPTRERWHEVHAFSLTMMLSQYGQRTYGPSAMLTGSPVAVTMWAGISKVRRGHVWCKRQSYARHSGSAWAQGARRPGKAGQAGQHMSGGRQTCVRRISEKQGRGGQVSWQE